MGWGPPSEGCYRVGLPKWQVVGFIPVVRLPSFSVFFAFQIEIDIAVQNVNIVGRRNLNLTQRSPIMMDNGPFDSLTH